MKFAETLHNLSKGSTKERAERFWQALMLDMLDAAKRGCKTYVWRGAVVAPEVMKEIITFAKNEGIHTTYSSNSPYGLGLPWQPTDITFSW